eukprot:CAMPEP_0197585808 /NCGR_PEP_ID=MMETSP1326-20131121/7989_1 /TAXON_ID=1155430 /ORGANISM="Genus nov. species nov., Strain RCC2288" /LENGTH=589 /DNA_ID=CAMNT_0043150361 /DNA_START=341 /DNA_END=2107 /DNA_ORIENTATION=-
MVPEQTARCEMCAVDDVAVSEGICCRGKVQHFTCKSCFGQSIATLCTAPYNTFRAQDMHVYCFAPMLGIECNAAHPQTALAFTLLDMAAHGNDAPERGLVAFLKAREAMTIVRVPTRPQDAEIDQLNQLLDDAHLKAGAPAHLVKQLALQILNEALVVPTPCCQRAYTHDACAAVSTSGCCQLPNVNFCGLCMEMFVEPSAASERLTHDHLRNVCKYNTHKTTDGIFPRESSKRFAQRSIFRERIVNVLRAVGTDGANGNHHDVQRAVLEVVRVHLTSLGINVDGMIAELTGEGVDDCAALGAWREQCPKLRAHWDESEPVTAWQGVTFGQAGGTDAGRVVKIGLIGHDLKGVLPGELGNLTALTWLSLAKNQLTTVPAAALEGLTALTKLFLDRNLLSSVPEELGGLTALTLLNLNGNQLMTVPAALGGLTALTQLYLSENQLSIVPKALGGLTALTTLGLSGNKLTSVPEELGSLAALTALDLGGNQLASVPAALGGLTALKVLYLKGNLLMALPAELGRLAALTTLSLSRNQLTTLPAELGGLTALTALDLGGNQLTTVPAALGALTALTQLGLSGNQLTSVPVEW